MSELQDRVVIMLLFDQVVVEEQVHEVWKAWEQARRDGGNAPLWRFLARHPDLDQDKIYECAARVSGYQEARIVQGSILPLMNAVADGLSRAQLNRLINFGVVPVGVEQSSEEGPALVFASHDPGHPDLMRMLRDLGLGRVELTYASTTVVQRLINEANWRRRRDDLPLSWSRWAQSMEGAVPAALQTFVVPEPSPMHAGIPDAFTLEDKRSREATRVVEAEIRHGLLVDLFEGALLDAVRQGADAVWFVPNARRQVEVYVQFEERRTFVRTATELHPEAMIAFVESEVLDLGVSARDVARDGLVQRWIDDTLHRMRVSIEPYEEQTGDEPAFCAVVRLVDQRKVMSDFKRLGPRTAR